MSQMIQMVKAIQALRDEGHSFQEIDTLLELGRPTGYHAQSYLLYRSAAARRILAIL